MALWCVMPSGSPIRASGGGVENGDTWLWRASPRVEAPSQVAVQKEVMDRATGMRLTLSEHPSGALQVRATGGVLEVIKRVTVDGEVTLTLRAADDRVSVVSSRKGVVVTRGRRTARVDLARADASAERTAVLLAGSPAIRLFRRAVSGMEASTRSSAAGLALELADVLLRVLQDDPAAVPAWREARLAAHRAPLEAETCYSAWETEVLAAWETYDGCYHDFSWWSGGREVCAGLYIIRVESAWFKLIGCSSIKIV